MKMKKGMMIRKSLNEDVCNGNATVTATMMVSDNDVDGHGRQRDGRGC